MEFTTEDIHSAFIACFVFTVSVMSAVTSVTCYSH